MLLDCPSDGVAAIRTQFGAIFVSLELLARNGRESALAETRDYRIVAQEARNWMTGDPAGIAECMVRAHP
ncbi:hypothetical protein [Bradyrhizobium sp. NAS96.2]|uniref:hypothetical protein n=1 Tax=Bradyrhizobium sp. NAS96.2 TaxID=1680160 RepID=UPI00093B63AD|nr:hypothetical protein [Bradyrhizobium sp. NAS96.2]OKO81861.1 hypothetical protein AC628_05665 [Bradyrhizobium sp. NAS96.2]